LNVTYHYVGSWSYYFPLKRASWPEQYVLGRAFLQETHISVDFDSGYFNLSQARLGSSQANIVAIQPRGDVPNKSSRLATGAYAGIGVGAGILAIAIGLLVLSWTKKWWPFKKANLLIASETHAGKQELHQDAISKVEAMEKKRVELETIESRHGLANSTGLDGVHELDAPVHDHGVLASHNS